MGHLKDNNISYPKHFKRSMKFAWHSWKASFCFFVHAVCPAAFKDTGSDIIKKMNFD